MAEWRVIEGDCLERLRGLEAASAQTCVTSPPYYGLRDYGIEPTVWGGDPEHAHEWGEPIVDRATNHTDKRRWQHTRNGRDEEQPPEKRVASCRTSVVQGTFCDCGAWRGSLGLEPTPELYVEHLVAVFCEVGRVLAEDGTLWLNLGDSYSANGGHNRPYKPKDLMLIPAQVALALRADGWYVRDEIIWSKPAPMPTSAKDRTCRAHEVLYTLTRSARYYYDQQAIAEPSVSDHDSGNGYGRPEQLARGGRGQAEGWTRDRNPTRIKRSVWTVGTAKFSAAHFATFPPKLIEPCILAGSRPGDTVLDPFAGAGTTGLVATRHGRGFIGVELNPAYAEMARQRIRDDAPLLNYVSEAA